VANDRIISVAIVAEPSQTSPSNLGEYAWAVDTDEWYCFERGPIQFINIASESRKLEEKLEWLESILQKVDRRRTPWVVAAARRPWDAVDVNLLKSSGVDVVLVGSDNYYGYLDAHSGPDYTVFWPMADPAIGVGRLIVRTGDELVYEIVDHDGAVKKRALLDKQIPPPSRTDEDLLPLPTKELLGFDKRSLESRTQQLKPMTTDELLALSGIGKN
jgi:hypothetical protein